MRLAIDAMGGDYAPEQIVKGTLEAALDSSQVTFQLYGDEKQISQILGEQKPENIEIHHTEDVITGDDDPVRAVRRKREASLVVAAHAVKNGEADGLLSCGNTGALVASGILIVGRMTGIDRPALMATLPAIGSTRSSIQYMDAGANSDAKPLNVYQHAVLGDFYAREILGIDHPTLALLNNGTEENKGSKLLRESYAMISEDESLNFIGNMEARDILSGVADVIVADGFTGNAVLKSMEGTASSIMKLLKESVNDGGVMPKVGAYLLKDTLKEMMKSLNSEEIGGALIFGLKAPVMKAHGSSKAKAVNNALKQLEGIVASDMFSRIEEKFSITQ